MIIKEKFQTSTQNLAESGKPNYTFTCIPQFDTEYLTIQLDTSYYEQNKEQFEKDLLDFISYSILGYTENIVKIEEETVQKKEVLYDTEIIDGMTAEEQQRLAEEINNMINSGTDAE